MPQAPTVPDAPARRVLKHRQDRYRRSPHSRSEGGACRPDTDLRPIGQIELPAAGLGSLNYDHFLKRLAERHPNIPIIIEHLDEADVPRSKKFLDDKFRANGL